MIIVNDNLGIIIDEKYLALMPPIIKEKILKGVRKVEDTVENHAKEELRLSLKIAKTNTLIDPINKYYFGVLDKIQTEWSAKYA